MIVVEAAKAEQRAQRKNFTTETQSTQHGGAATTKDAVSACRRVGISANAEIVGKAARFASSRASCPSFISLPSLRYVAFDSILQSRH
jgi:hypothetical protein